MASNRILSFISPYHRPCDLKSRNRPPTHLNTRSTALSRSRSPTHSKKHSRSRSRCRSYSGDRRRSYRSHSRRSDSRRSVHENTKLNKCLGIFGLSTHTTETHLYDTFEKYGSIENIFIITGVKSRISRGFGFIHFKNHEDAILAKKECSDMEIHGRRIRLDFSVTQRPHTPTPGIYMGRPNIMREGRLPMRRGYDRFDNRYDRGERYDRYNRDRNYDRYGRDRNYDRYDRDRNYDGYMGGGSNGCACGRIGGY